MQQVVSFPSTLVRSETGKIARMTKFEPVLSTQTANTSTGYPNGNDMLTAALSPLFPQQMPPNIGVSVDCSSGNCTWDPFVSLTVCSKCKDISPYHQYGCLPTFGDWEMLNLSRPNTSTEACGFFANSEVENSVLMSGYTVDPVTYAPMQFLESRSINFPDVETRQQVTGSPYGEFDNVPNKFAQFIVAGISGGIPSVHEGSAITAHECVLYWCTKRITARMDAAILNEDVMATMPMPVDDNSNGNLSTFNFYDVSLEVSEAAMSRARLLAHNLLTFTSTYANSTSRARFNLIQTGESFDLADNPWLPPNNVSSHLETIAAAITTNIRNQASFSDFAVGSAYSYVTLVKVKWTWLSLPLIILVFSLIFLGATIRRTMKDASYIGVWKNNIMAVLQNSLGDDVQKALGPETNIGNVRKNAGRIDTVLG